MIPNILMGSFCILSMRLPDVLTFTIGDDAGGVEARKFVKDPLRAANPVAGGVIGIEDGVGCSFFSLSSEDDEEAAVGFLRVDRPGLPPLLLPLVVSSFSFPLLLLDFVLRRGVELGVDAREEVEEARRSS